MFLVDRTNGRTYATVLRPSSSSSSSSVCLSVTLCVVAKRCVLEQKLLLRAYRKSYMRNRLVDRTLTVPEIFNVKCNTTVDVTLIRPLNKGQGHSFWYQ